MDCLSCFKAALAGMLGICLSSGSAYSQREPATGRAIPQPATGRAGLAAASSPAVSTFPASGPQSTQPASAGAGEDYSALVAQATSFYSYFVSRGEPDPMRAKLAMKELAEKKDRVGPWIIAVLEGRVPAPKQQVDPALYGAVLREFGPEYVLALEPGVLLSPNVETRVQGVTILGQIAGGPKAKELLVAVLKRDASPRVQAAVIRCLHSNPEVVVEYLGSEQAEVRRAAAFFFLECPGWAPKDRLQRMVDGEKDPETSSLIAWTLCRVEGFPALSLISHENPGIRLGALHFYAEGAKLSAEGQALVSARLDKEKDPACRFKIARILAWRGDPRCLPTFIELLACKDQFRVRWDNYETSSENALHALDSLTGQSFGPTEEDRETLRTWEDKYYRVAQRYERWWMANMSRLKWDSTQHRFVVAEEQRR